MDQTAATCPDATPGPLARLGAGDQAAMPDVLRRYGSMISRIVRRFRRRDAEDLRQAIWLKLWTVAPRYDPSRAKETTFVYTVVRNECIEWLRTSRCPAAVGGCEIEPQRREPSPEDAAVRRDLLSSLRGLSLEHHEQALRLSLCGVSGRGIASGLGA